MFDKLLSCKRAYKLFLRRASLRTNQDREHSRSLHETLNGEKPESRGRCRTWVVLLIISTAFYLYLHRSLDEKPADNLLTSEDIEDPVYYNLRSLWRAQVPIGAHKINENKVLTSLKSWKKRRQERIVNKKDTIMNYTSTSELNETTSKKPFEKKIILLPICVLYEKFPAKFRVNASKIVLSLEDVYLDVQQGGYYTPHDCRSQNKVAILVPYRNRTRNLAIFLFNIHPFLMAQKLEYRIFVIEQYGTEKFNKGRLFNAGFKEMKKYGDWKCIVLHDVDLLPLSPRIFYTCPKFPRHMSSVVTDKGSTRDTGSPILFGGVTSMSVEHYQKANGHSNLYWGWGGEDYDMFWRIKAAGLPVMRYNKTIARYLALSHSRGPINPLRYDLLRTALVRCQDEGLNTVHYKVMSVFQRHLYTHLIIDVNPLEADRGIMPSKQTALGLTL